MWSRRSIPYAFAEQGARLSSVLRSQRAVQVNVDLRRKIDGMEKRYDARFQAVFETIRQMLETPVPAKKANRISRKTTVTSEVDKARAR